MRLRMIGISSSGSRFAVDADGELFVAYGDIWEAAEGAPADYGLGDDWIAARDEVRAELGYDEPHSYAVEAMEAGASHDDVLLAMCRDLDAAGVEVPESLRVFGEASLRGWLDALGRRSALLEAMFPRVVEDERTPRGVVYVIHPEAEGGGCTDPPCSRHRVCVFHLGLA